MLLQFSTKTAEADTSSELAKKSKETFRKEVSQTFCEQCFTAMLFHSRCLNFPNLCTFFFYMEVIAV